VIADSNVRVVVVGGSNAPDFARVIEALPPESTLAVIAHSEAGPDAIAAELKAARMPVERVTSNAKVAQGRIFIVPSDKHVEIRDRTLVVTPKTSGNNTLDILLRSVADTFAAQTIAVILGGPGANGSLGIKRIKEVGGITMAESGSNGTEMPRSAIATGLIDLVLPLAEIEARLTNFGTRTPIDEDKSSTDGAADTLRDILTLVRVRSGHDFAPYKRATLFRRISRRMQVSQSDSITEYHRFLRDHPGELAHLLRDLLISVTNFMRDPEAFETLAREIVPKIFANKGPEDQVRVWVPGCATGEEVYSIAMLLREHALRHDLRNPLQLFATDIDEEALAEARNARYPESIVVDLGQERLDRFFRRENGAYCLVNELRETVLFSPHNLLRDPPFSRLDMVSCRNLLIYLNREAQDRVLNLFHFALRPDGFLFLGSSESAENTSMFASLDAKHRIYQRRTANIAVHGPDGLVPAGRWHAPHPKAAAVPPTEQRATTLGELHFRAVEHYAPPSVMVDQDLEILHVSEHAGRFLAVAGGEPSKNLLRLVIAPLRLDLRTAIYAAKQPGRMSEVRTVRFEDNGTPRVIELRVVANGLDDIAGTILVLFDEKRAVETPGEPQRDLSAIEPVVREMEDELLRTRDQLRTTIEQYETSLEELKASNEELQAINEELRSATEELETSKEELQSVNEELSTLNQELKVKVDEISHANADLQNLMSSTDIGVLFLDRHLNIKRFTPRIQDLFNVIPSDTGRPLSHLTHRLDIEDLAEQARSVIASLRTSEREVTSDGNRRYLMRLLPYRSLDDRIDGVVATFVDVTDLREAVEAKRAAELLLATSEERLHHALLTAPLVMLNVGSNGEVVWGFARGKELQSSTALQLFSESDANRFTQVTRQVLARKQSQRIELEVQLDGRAHTYDFRIEPAPRGVYAIGFDITPSKQAEASLRENDRRKDEFLATLSHELRNPLTPLKIALDVARLSKGDAERTRSFDIMDRQVGQLEQLTNELLDLSRITQGKIELRHERIEVTQIVEAALEATRPLITQHHHTLEVKLADGKYHVSGDLMRLAQVLTNLLTNAAKYTPDRGRIELVVQPVHARGIVEIRVRDNGIGIAPEALDRIFDIFMQVRSTAGVQGGLGIGLNLVRKLVELHGGSVTARSPGLDHGTEMIVELPLTT
jgi:two-component system CheB/CheR fusion protein